jgi:TonB family protein
MKWCARFGMLVALSSTLAFAQSSITSGKAPPRCNPDLLDPNSFAGSEDDVTHPGFDLYRKTIYERVRKNWYLFIPRQARYPELRTACVGIEFYISKEGNIEQMKLGYTSGDDELDQAAWEGIRLSSPFEPTPAGISEPILVRLNFLYNPEAHKISARVVDSLDTLIATQALALSVGPPPWRSSGPLPEVQTQIFPLGGDVPSAVYSPTPSCALPAGAVPVGGDVFLSLIVTKKGDVRHLKVTQSLSRELDENARNTIATWKFQPVHRYGKPIDMPLGVKVTFNLK